MGVLIYITPKPFTIRKKSKQEGHTPYPPAQPPEEKPDELRTLVGIRVSDLPPPTKKFKDQE